MCYNNQTYTWPTAENDTDHRSKSVIFVFNILHILDLLSCNLLILLNKITTNFFGIFFSIYNPLIYLSYVESVQVKKKKILLSCFVGLKTTARFMMTYYWDLSQEWFVVLLNNVLHYQQTILLYFNLLLSIIYSSPEPKAHGELL